MTQKIYRDEKGRFASGKKVTDYLRDSAYADALIRESLGRVLDEKNAEIWDEPKPEQKDIFFITDWLINNGVKVFLGMFLIVATIFLAVRI